MQGGPATSSVARELCRTPAAFRDRSIHRVSQVASLLGLSATCTAEVVHLLERATSGRWVRSIAHPEHCRLPQRAERFRRKIVLSVLCCGINGSR